MATTQHYLWASGHFLLLLSALRYFVGWITFSTPSPWWYKASFTGALVSYAIVCQKYLGTPKLSADYVKRALTDENVQYFLLAFFWWSSKPIALTLLPYTIFSLFHALTFTRTTLMPQFLPPSPPATAGGPAQPHPFAKRLQGWVKSNYNPAMRAVAFMELVIFVRVLMGAVTLQNSLVSPIFYAHFLRQRYYDSAFTRDAVHTTDGEVGRLVGQGPPVVGQVWEKVRMVVVRWGGSSLRQQQQQQQQQPGGAGAGGGGAGAAPRRG